MKKTSYIFVSAFACLTFLFAAAEGNEVVVRSPEGDAFVIDVDAAESFVGVVQQLQSCFGSNQEYLLDFKSASRGKKQIKAITAPIRNYYAPVTAEEIKDLSYIINTVGMSSLVTIATSQSSIKKAGKRIDHLHPLNFLKYIFLDKRMVTSMRALQKRNWVSGEFYDGLRESMECELARDNVKAEHINDFAATLNIDPSRITPAIQKRQWKQLVNILINHSPRDPNEGRYDDQ